MFKGIEKRWQNYWEENEIFKFDLSNLDKKLYCLEMFSYPSGSNLHIGHWYNFGIGDAWARFKMMQGYKVFHPMGFDSFGLPAENFAIKTGIHPQDSIINSINTMRNQLKEMGSTYDWNYEVITSNKEYYKWTQWLFVELYKNGLAYKKEALVNWCPSCGTVLANEQVISGNCERCGSVVERKKMSQWFFKITDYAEELLNDLDDLDWPERTKVLQRNWIGRSEGANIVFDVFEKKISFEVFTTRPDTLYGCTYCVLAPENDLVDIITTDEYKDIVEDYKVQTSKLSEVDRLSTIKEKTGVFTGSYAINPINNKKVPIWISDYVVSTYGTGAVMAVPAHDERDFDFAKKFDLEIIQVIESDSLPYILDGKMINSEEMNGLVNKEGSVKIVEKLKKLNKGKSTITYKLRDWLVSRQRYWGAPIPVIYCDCCGIVIDENLPVELPYDVKFSNDGKSPLITNESFLNVKCPKCGKPSKREVDTLDTFVCSSWYFLRYPSAKNDKEPFDKDLINKLLPVDKYIGGIEHACMHLLYSRFVTKALRDMGYINFSEPFKSLIHQGMILGEDGEKMSKSKGNALSPDKYVKEYGSDVFRTYLMFGFNFVDGGPWSEEGVKAINKFYIRVSNLIENFKHTDELNLDKSFHYALKHATIDIEKFQFNTALSRIMEYVNDLYKQESINKYYIENLIIMLVPFAPHICEELWRKIGNNSCVIKEKWPIYDDSKIKSSTFEMVIQVNGKIRAKLEVDENISKDEMKSMALSKVDKYIDNNVVKIIVVPKKLVNIVIREK